MTTEPGPRHPYEDRALPIERRVADLAGRLDLADKIGLLFHPYTVPGDPERPDHYGRPALAGFLRERRITHFSAQGSLPSAREFAAWHNRVQEIAAEHPLRIPVTFSSDPRHSVTDNPLTGNEAGVFSRWPEPLGLAAIGTSEANRAFGEAVRAEYRAVGITVALHPQIDLTTEPRWARQVQTYGEDAGLTARCAVAFLEGLAGERHEESVSGMIKHFPGGGPQLGGRDPHFPDGREQVYPGGQWDLHLKPFIEALAAGAPQVMPYYGMPVGTEFEEVGFAFNRGVITGILRERLGFDGVVCTDFGIITGYGDIFPAKAWGVEHLSEVDRIAKVLDAGCDQFGGEHRTDLLADAVASGLVTEERLDVSVRRVLTEKFRLGLFDGGRLVDEDVATAVVGARDHVEAGRRAQQDSLVLLRNDADASGRPTLPLTRGVRVYTEGMDAAAFDGLAEVVATPEDADVAVVRIAAPDYSDKAMGFLDSMRKGSLAFPDAEVTRLTALGSTVPLVLDVYLERPAILTGIEASALVGSFGTDDRPFAEVLFGDAAPHGRLPFDLPRSMAAVEASREDVPFDTADPLFRFGHGLTYQEA